MSYPVFIRPFIRTAMLIVCAAASAAWAQDFPSRPIRFIATNSPGTLQDLVARISGAAMSKVLGQPVVVENKPGAGNLVALEFVARQMPADGYTVCVVLVETAALLPITVKDVRLDPIKELPPVVTLVEAKLLLGSPQSAPWKTFNQMVAQARANPGKFNYGESSATQRFPTESLLRQFKIDIVRVPYTGGGPMVQGLVSGETQIGFAAESTFVGLGEKLNVLAVTGDNRSTRFPDVPTFKELGAPLPGVTVSLNVREGTPQTAINRLNAAALQALKDADVRAQFAKMRMDVVGDTPEAAAKRFVDTGRFFADVAKVIGYQPQ